jgi:hypothetical protein
MRQDARAISLLIAPGIALAMGALAVALESLGGGQWRGAALVGIGVVLIWAAAIAIYRLYPGRPIALLLFMLAAATATQTLVSSSNPYLFTAGRLTRPAVEVLLLWVMLAFPSGHLKRRREKILLLLAALAVPLLWLPAMMFAKGIPVPGPLIVCRSACPQNMLFVADHPALAKASALAFRLAGALAVMATAASASSSRTASAACWASWIGNSRLEAGWARAEMVELSFILCNVYYETRRLATIIIIIASTSRQGQGADRGDI